MAVGIWAWTEKDTFSNLQRLTNVALDPAFILIVAGAVTFIIGFTGCVGALRENTVLLSAVWCYNICSFHVSLYWTILFFFSVRNFSCNPFIAWNDCRNPRFCIQRLGKSFNSNKHKCCISYLKVHIIFRSNNKPQEGFKHL